MLKVNINYPLPKFNLCAELAISQGSIVGIYGPSGAGKSSLLACISGLVKDQVVINHNTNVTHLKAEQKGISHQLQSSQLFPHLDVAANLLFSCRHRPKNNNQLSFEEVVSQLEISELLKRDIRSLSGGEAQRVMFARTLLVGQNVILLDEPFSALDWQKRYLMLSSIRYFAKTKNITFILVSHSLKELSFCCEELVYLVSGKVIAKAATEQVISSITKQQGSPAFSYLKVGEVTFLKQHQLYKLTLLNSKQVIYSNVAATQVAQSICINAYHIKLMLIVPEQNDDTNIVKCRFELAEKQGQRVDIVLVVDGQRLICSISTLQWLQYSLVPGQTVFAQIPVNTVYNE